MEAICSKTPTCALFKGTLLKRKESAETYKQLFCKTVERHKPCKRYMISDDLGECPDFVMPNSTMSVEEIKAKMKREGLL